jgi:microcin C transport system substrate-binding protein
MRLRFASILSILILFPTASAAQGASQDMPAVPQTEVEAAGLDPLVHRAHAIAMHGEPKYGPDFSHFDYVNPDAPKGGSVRLAVAGTFDNFNQYIPKGNAASGLFYLTETLLTGSADEAFTEYGLLAESVEWPEDRSWVIFHLRPEARWHDGQPVTVDDVIFSLETLKTKGHPFYRYYYQSIESAEQVGEHSVRFNFAEEENRELPLIAGQLAILPKHYWEGRDFEKTTLEPPLGSGPYRIAEFEPGRFIVYERVEDYWGRDLPVNRGRYNIDRFRYEFYRDETVIRIALKAGDLDYRAENQAKAWALDYDVPAVREGWLKMARISHDRPSGMQAFVMNTRREVFSDPRVRQALAFAFDFEWSNRNLFFGQYTRTQSFFDNSELASRGLPEGEELEILERYRGRIPDEVFTKVYTVPSTDGSGWARDNLHRAFELLAEAGWEVRDLKLVDSETGRQMTFEILLYSPAFERVVLPFARNLKRLGIGARVRLVDQAQYINRLRSYDFDMIVAGWGQSESPGNEQREFWGSRAADLEGSRNRIGVKDPVIDELIELIISAPTRESLIAGTRALDRVLLWHHFVIPNWHLDYDRLLYWDKFAQPPEPPRRGTSLDFWWIDPAKETALEERRVSEQQTAGPESRGTPGLTLTIAALVGLMLAGYLVFRRALRRTPSQG